MGDFVCPICGSKDGCKQIENSDQFSYLGYNCQKWDFSYSLSESVLETDSEKRNKLYNLIFEHLLRQKFYQKSYKWLFYYNEDFSKAAKFPPYFVNLAVPLQHYPDSFAEYADRILLNLSIMFPKYGADIDLCTYAPWKYRRALLLSETDDMPDFHKILDSVSELGYLKHYKADKHSKHYVITAEGWKKIDSLKKEWNEIQQGFIAMSFHKETDPIREAFRQAIQESGYQVKIIDEKEHNNQIVPEIFFEIGRSKFVVVDVTYPNFGAYYEAGYAQALGKQVIICCRENEFKDKDKRPHFDISQKCMIVWQNETDLIARLKKRIEATVK